MATTFDVFYLGNLQQIDTAEGNQYVDTNAVNSWLGTYGSAGTGLSANAQTMSPAGSGYFGGISNAYDIDNSVSNDQMSINGTTKSFDAAMEFNATITYPDGTTANITAVVFQTTDGDVYLAPEYSNNADQMALEAGPIQSITLNAPIYAEGVFGQGYSLYGDRYAADFVPCFTLGTRIATSLGEVLVEDLKAGDRVFTRDNGIQELRWVGQQLVDKSRLKATPKFLPILIRKGAIGNGMPEHDLLVSPNHRILVTGANAALYFDDTEVLIAAKHLTMIDGIDVADVEAVTYIHLLFDQHEVVLSNGMWTESFLPSDHTLRGVGSEQRDEIYALFPELRDAVVSQGWRSARRVLRRHEAELLLHEN